MWSISWYIDKKSIILNINPFQIITTMKKILTLSIFLLAAASTFAGTYLKYYNSDSKDYVFKVVTCGNHTEVKFDHSTTSSVTIQGCSDAVITTPNGDIKVKDGDKLEIKDGVVKIVN